MRSITPYGECTRTRRRQLWRSSVLWTTGGECRGKPALREHWQGIFRVLERMTFFTQIAAIEVTGDRATMRSYCREILPFKGGAIRKLIGVYDDELVRDGDD
jgi:hypothetical protein